MHIAVVNLTNGGLSGGYRKYLEHLIPLLQEDQRLSGLDVFISPQARDMIRLDGPSLHVWPSEDPRNRYRWLRARLQQAAPDVVFVPTARWLACGSIPVLVMVRNMEPLLVPFGGNSLTEGCKNLARTYVARRACRRATRVLAVSNYVRDFLVQQWTVERDKIGVVYHGLGPLPGLAETVPPLALQALSGGKFLFTAGSLRPARGLADAIKALAGLKRRGLHYSLVIGGEINPGTSSYKERMQRLANEAGVGTDVLWAGQLDALEMSWCYYNSAAFIMTSRAEACPNVVLEALAHGCLCVSTSQEPMPEFFQAAALYYQPGKAEDLAAQLLKALSMPEPESRKQRSAATQRATQFTWKKTALATIAQLELAAG